VPAAPDLPARVRAAAAALERAAKEPPKVGVVLGSGLGAFAESLEGARALPYAKVPHFPRPAVAGHAGRAVFGRCAGVPLVALEGRAHFYEGHPLDLATLPVRALAALGAKALVLTNAAGGIRSDLRPGDLMVVVDHLNLLGANPLRGPHDERLGPRFPDLTRAYDPVLVEALRAAAHDCAFEVRRGVYAAMTGPSYETPAEVRMLRTLGADAVGMSTVPEVIVARQCGMRVAAVSAITNMAAGITGRALSHEEVLESGRRIADRLTRLLRAAVPRIATA
jgi:purine-nucleoside phosphorylase